MKFFPYCILLLWGGVAFGYGATNSWQTKPVRLLKPAELHSLPEKEHFARIFENRLVHNVTNRVNPFRLIRHLEREEEYWTKGVTLAEEIDEDFESAFSRSARLTLRQYFVDEVDFFDVMKDRLGDFARNTLSGFEERDNLVSPFHDEEGHPAQSGIRKRRGLKFGLRPFRTSSPYAFASYGRKDREGNELFNMHLRYYYRDWKFSTAELVADVPLPRQFHFTAGVYVRTGEYLRRGDDPRDDSDYFVGKAGIYGPLRKGILYLGADITSRQRVLVSYIRSW